MASIIQANINHCSAAQDLLAQVMTEKRIQLAIVSEPCWIPNTPTWFSDISEKATLIKGRGCPAISKAVRGNGFVLAEIGNVTVCSCYFSPNDNMRKFENFLDDIAIALGMQSNVLLGGDFNAKSIMWGSRTTNARGRVLEQWASSLNLVLQNKGKAPTCIRHQGSSIIDLTWARGETVRHIKNWKVDQWSETYSDHNYIFYNLNKYKNWNITRSSKKRWNIAKLDNEKFDTCVLGNSWSAVDDSTPAKELVDGLMNVLRQAWNESMPKKKCSQHPKQVFWWNDTIANIRKECIKYKRILTRIRKARSADEEVLLSARLHLKEKRKELRMSINKAKDQERKEMFATIEGDPWGKPYKLVMGRLSGRGDPPLKSLTVDAATRAIESLFPSGEPCTSSEVIQMDWDSALTVSENEIERALKKAAKGKKAPGPDGISAKILLKAYQLIPTVFTKTYTKCLQEGFFLLNGNGLIWFLFLSQINRRENRHLTDRYAY